MADLRAEYEQLLFFSVPKLLHLYQNLTAHEPNPVIIVHDVGFLFQNKPDVQLKLKKTVKVGWISVLACVWQQAYNYVT